MKLHTITCSAAALACVLALSSVTLAEGAPLFDYVEADGLFAVDEFDPPMIVAGSELLFFEPLADLAGDLEGRATMTSTLSVTLDGIADDFECSALYSYIVEPGRITIADHTGFTGVEFCPETYAGGTVLLEIEIWNMELWVTLEQCERSLFSGDFQIVGGAWFDAVSTEGVGWTGRFEGVANQSFEFGECPGDGDMFQRLASFTGRFTANPPVPAAPRSWSRLKDVF